MKRLWFSLGGCLVVATIWMVARPGRSSVVTSNPSPIAIDQGELLSEQASESGLEEPVITAPVMTMADVIIRAEQVRSAMAESLDDYTATFHQQERESDGTLGEETVMEMKVQTRLRGPENDAPMRVFLRYVGPEAKRGRKVIWGEDLYKGQLAVHEVGMLLGLKTIWLDPEGMIAMRGQRYPIGEIGMVKLVEKLIERGKASVDTEGLKISVIEGHQFDGLECELVRIVRPAPNPEDEDDFQVAEILLDPARQLIISYRSFGWPENEGEEPPLLEAYSYRNVQTNVGLTEKDFDVQNPEYGYPAF